MLQPIESLLNTLFPDLLPLEGPFGHYWTQLVIDW